MKSNVALINCYEQRQGSVCSVSDVRSISNLEPDFIPSVHDGVWAVICNGVVGVSHQVISISGGCLVESSSGLNVILRGGKSAEPRGHDLKKVFQRRFNSTSHNLNIQFELLTLNSFRSSM